MALTSYKKKRNFTATPEPEGQHKNHSGPKKLRFVVQEHHATQLHFDFRLEMDGVLKSWAVPKGPSLDPKDRRLAMHVEDHPLEYRTFHGTIPDGNYGAGQVRIWDSGTYETVKGDNPESELRSGNLKLILHGRKLKGEFHLVRMHHAAADRAWLLFKHKDEYSKSGWTLEPILNYGSRTERPGISKSVLSRLLHTKVAKKVVSATERIRKAQPAKRRTRTSRAATA